MGEESYFGTGFECVIPTLVGKKLYVFAITYICHEDDPESFQYYAHIIQAHTQDNNCKTLEFRARWMHSTE